MIGDKFKVLHIFNEIKYSGAEIMYANAAHIFQERGIELLVFSTGEELGEYSKVFEENGIKCFHWPIQKKKINLSIKAIKKNFAFYKFLKNHKIDVLHIHRADLYFLALVAKIAKIPTIKTVHNVHKNRIFTLPIAILTKFFARKLLKVKFQTIGKSVYTNELYYYKNPSIIINNWYNNSKFYPLKNDSEKKELRTKLGIEQDKFVIVSVGNCSKVKNHHDIIKSLPLIKNKINIIYLHLGTGETEEEEKKLAIELGVYNKIKFMGNQKNVSEFLIMGDVFVMPSEYEGLGISAIEAMACALPVILYNVPGLRDLIKNANEGYLIEPNFTELANNLLYISRNYTEAKAKGLKGYEKVKHSYSMEKNVMKIIDLYRNDL